MATKRKYDLARLEEAAAKATATSTQSLTEKGFGDFKVTCRSYLKKVTWVFCYVCMVVCLVCYELLSF